MCVCERQGDREGERGSVCVCVCVCMCVVGGEWGWWERWGVGGSDGVVTNKKNVKNTYKNRWYKVFFLTYAESSSCASMSASISPFLIAMFRRSLALNF